MQSKTGKTILCAVAAVLLAHGASASDPPFDCTTDGNQNWSVHVIGPFTVTCPDGGDCTAVYYQITQLKTLAPAFVSVLADHDASIVVPEPADLYEPCVGDNFVRNGLNDCSSRAVRLDDDGIDPDKNAFTLMVRGQKAVTDGSLVVKNGSVYERCRIASLGQDKFDVHAQRTTSQQVVFKGCTVTIPTDPVTGETGEATISGEGCVFAANAEPVSEGELIVDGKNVGAFTFGDGYISSGASSCTTKVISNRLYSWCTCADTNHDGIPDDPKPPCPATVSN
jgi:hypothetical protein